MNRSKFVRILCIILAVIMALSLLISVLPAVARAEDESDDDFEQQLAALNEEKETAKYNVTNARNKVEKLKEEQALVIEEKIALEERNAAALKAISLVE